MWKELPSWGAGGTFRLRRLLDQVLVVPKDEVEPEMQMEEDLLFQFSQTADEKLSSVPLRRNICGTGFGASQHECAEGPNRITAYEPV